MIATKARILRFRGRIHRNFRTLAAISPLRARRGTARPALRRLREDLHPPLPPVSRPLDEVDHPLLRKAGEQLADAAAPHERIAAVDDRVLSKAKAKARVRVKVKVKVGRWRGAAWVEPDQPWLVATGRREDGSPDDFYAALAADARAARAQKVASPV